MHSLRRICALGVGNLQVRGAPLIGVAAALCLAASAGQKFTEGQSDGLSQWVVSSAAKLEATRPTAVNLRAALQRMTNAVAKHTSSAKSSEDSEFAHKLVETLSLTADAIADEDSAMCDEIARNGAALIPDNSGILTICNTGSLATAGVGTALGCIQHAFQKDGKQMHVYVLQTRPLLQGGRLTVGEDR